VSLHEALHRCKCPTVECEETPGLPQCLRCKECQGWVTYRISTMEELETARRVFAPREK